MGILFFWACRERVVAMTLKREGEMAKPNILDMLERRYWIRITGVSKK